MKSLIILTLGFVFNFSSLAQKTELLEQFKLLKEQIAAVDLGRTQYEQSIEYETDNPSNITITIEEIDAKRGRSTQHTYQFNLSLLDKNSIRRVSNSKEMKVVLKARKDIFQVSEDGEWKGYEDEIEIMAQDIDAAKDLEKEFEATLPLAKEYQASVTMLPDEIQDLLEWITKQIENVEVKEETIDQSCTLNDTYPDIITLDQNEDGDEHSTTLSLGDLNPSSLSYEIKSDKVQIKATTTKGKDFVLNKEDDELKYGDDLLIYARDPLQATQLLKALDIAIPLCDSLIQLRLPEPNTQQEAIAILQKKLSNFSFNDKSYDQSLSTSCKAIYQWKEAEGDTKSYQFLWGDLDMKSAKIEVGKDKIEVSVETKKNENYIEVLENGELGGFENEVVFLAPNIEAARVTLAVLKFAIEQCPVQLEARDLKWLDQALQNISKREEDLSQSITLTESGEPCELTYSITEAGKSDDTELYEFALEDLDLRRLNLSIRGKTIELNLKSKGGEKSITHSDNDGDISYEDDFELRFPDVESGRVGLLTLQALGEGCKDK